MLILVSAVLVQSGSGAAAEISFLYRIALAAILLSLFHWVTVRRIPARRSAWIQVFGDLGLVTLLVYSSGGPDSVFTFFYVVVIGTAGFLLHRLGAVLTASTAAILYGSMVELVAYGALRSRRSRLSRSGPGRASATTSRSRSSGSSESP